MFFSQTKRKQFTFNFAQLNSFDSIVDLIFHFEIYEHNIFGLEHQEWIQVGHWRGKFIKNRIPAKTNIHGNIIFYWLFHLFSKFKTIKSIFAYYQKKLNATAFNSIHIKH
jgi:hypothetical protein